MPPTSLNLRLDASHGVSFYSNSMEIATAVEMEGKEIEEWQSMLPVEEVRKSGNVAAANFAAVSNALQFARCSL